MLDTYQGSSAVYMVYYRKTLISMETGSKGQIWAKNWVFRKFLWNASLDFFDFVHDVRHL